MESTIYKYNLGLTVVLTASIIALPLMVMQGILFDVDTHEFTAQYMSNGGYAITIIGIIGYIIILIYLLPILYYRLYYRIALEIFLGKKLTFYTCNGKDDIFFDDIAHIEFIKNPGKSGTKSIIIETVKKRESQVLGKFLGISFINGDNNIRINLGGIDGNPDHIYEIILSEYSKALKKQLKV